MDVTVETHILAPRDQVAAYAMTPENDPDWIGGIHAVERLDDGDYGVGSQVSRTASFLGRDIAYVLEVTEFEPGTRIRMRSVKGPFPMDVTYAFADADDGGTEVTNRVAGDASGFYRVASRMMARQVTRNLTQDMAQLKAKMELRASYATGT